VAICAGRRQEFAEFAAFRDADKRAQIPDPIDPATFHASRLNREDRDTQRGRTRLDLIRRLLEIRRDRLQPLMRRQRRGGQSRSSGDILIVDWALGDTRWSMRANFSTSAITVVPAQGTSCVFALRAHAESANDVTLAAAGVYVGAS
jgi:maltooligosyltrehalose trehalohydrolase